jgi:hypothetical protein
VFGGWFAPQSGTGKLVNASLASLAITFADLMTTDEVIKALGVVVS